MITCCPTCSGDAFGVQAASICTECATATVGGVALSVPLLFGCLVAIGVAMIAISVLRRRPGAWAWNRRPAQA